MSTSSVDPASLDVDVVKDLRSCDDACLEPLNIFKHAWEYRGEGNANVVLALQDDQRVVRLSKVNVDENTGDLSKHRRKVEREVIFANKVFGPLIGPEFVGSVKAIQLDGEEISQLNQLLQNIRPDHRLHKELRVPYATSHSDFARIHGLSSKGSDFCIEIKPKQGWWPMAMRNFGDESGSALCTYCLNQFLKLKRSKISSRTFYCPLDLFSGNPERMIEAVTALIANPQNNFRIFCNGKLVFGEYNDESLETVLNDWMGSSDASVPIEKHDMPSALNSFIYLLCVSLLKPKYIPDKCRYQASHDLYKTISRQLRKKLAYTPPSELSSKILQKSPHAKETTDFLSHSCNAEAAPLPEGCILSRILEIQKLADRKKKERNAEFDPSIYKIYQKICPVHSFSGGHSHSDINRMSHVVLSSDYSITRTDSGKSQILNVFLTGDDAYDSNADSGTETERLSDSESFEECFDTSSTEDDDEDTITSVINLEGCEQRRGSSSFVECPSSECLNVEKWLDEIDYLPLSHEEIMEVEMYLLAATAKDCSIMVTFTPTDKKEEVVPTTEYNYQNTDLHIKDLCGGIHRVRIGVADLDPKPVTTIARHYFRDKEMLQAYLGYYRNNIM